MKNFFSLMMCLLSALLLMTACQSDEKKAESDYEEMIRRTDAIYANELQPKVDGLTNSFNNHKEALINFRSAFYKNISINLKKNGEVFLSDGDRIEESQISDLPVEQQNAFYELQSVINFESIYCSPSDITFRYYRDSTNNPMKWVYLYYNEQISAEENSNDDWIFLDDHWFIERGVGWGV